MTDKKLLSLCLKLFEYKDGILIRKVGVSNRKKGEVAGHHHSATGYQTLRINNKSYYVHRIIFLMHHHYLPHQIDHIDMDRSNNKIENLRAATESENKFNIKARKGTKSGVKNVVWCKDTEKWRVLITAYGKSHCFGRFSSLEDAAEVAKKQREVLHGEFCRA